MNMPYEGVVQNLIDTLSAMPGIGPKSATRIAFHCISQEGHEDALQLGAVLTRAAQTVRFCEQCHNVADGDLCQVCRNPKRNRSVICVVGTAVDVSAVEKIRDYTGLYHVLGGLISPLEGVGPDELNIRSLVARLADGDVTEVILATDPNITGEATATYLARLLKSTPVRVTRIATGVSVGSDLNYADELTLGRAFEGRRVISAA